MEHYHAEQEREYREIVELPEIETREVAEVFEGYGLTPEQAALVVAAVCSEPKRWVDFMMRYELGLEAPDPRRAVRSAATIAVSYIIGGMIPLSPYFAASTVVQGLWVSVLVTLIALFVFGYVKGRLTGIHPLRGGIRTVVIGGLAAGAAFALARAIS
jgi:vacuolar iron transporter family protein